MKVKTIMLVFATIAIVGCAQVPKSSVKLSASITKDIQSMQKSHRQFINFYYDALEEQVNNLIDNKYRPSLIRNILNQDLAYLKKMETQHKSLLNAVQLAFLNPNNLSNEELEKAQANAMSGLQIFYTKIDVQVERKRQPLLLKLKNQRQQLLSESSQSYNNIIKKNNVITNILSSVSDVHDSQKELLELIGMDTDTREQIGGKLSTLSEKVIEINSSVSEKTSKVDDIEKAIDKLTKLFEK